MLEHLHLPRRQILNPRVLVNLFFLVFNLDNCRLLDFLQQAHSQCQAKTQSQDQKEAEEFVVAQCQVVLANLGNASWLAIHPVAVEAVDRAMGYQLQ